MPRPRKRVDYAPAIADPLEKGVMINEVRAAFQALVPELVRGELHNKPMEKTVVGDSLVFNGCRCPTCRAIAAAVHNIVFGLSGATAHPPDCFRLAGSSPPPSRGRPKSIEAKIIAMECRWHYDRITASSPDAVGVAGKRATSTGAFGTLVARVFAALHMPFDNPERAVKEAIACWNAEVLKAEAELQARLAECGSAERNNVIT
jgi:hypothetical protein